MNIGCLNCGNDHNSKIYCDEMGTFSVCPKCGASSDYHINVKDLWCEFGDVTMNPDTECIEFEWHGFPAGTHREEIWHWFEETFDISVVKLMYGK